MSIKERWLDRVMPPQPRQFASADEAFRRDMEARRDASSAERNKFANEMLPFLLPKILDAIRDMAPAEARGLAQAAAESRPLDDASLRILCDWLRDQQYDGLADEIARMPLDGGHLVIVRFRDNVSAEAFEEIRAWMRAISPGVRFLLVPHDWDVMHLKWDKKES